MGPVGACRLALARILSEFREHSYIRRRGRLTKAQARALDEYSAGYAIAPEQILVIAGAQPVGIEIGFGMGHALLRWAAEAAHWQLFGIELYQPGIGALTDGLQRAEIGNVHILEYPAQAVFASLPSACVDEVRIFFPDPWPKKRHHKRRLIQPQFVDELARVVKASGLVRIATDWTPYAKWIRECFSASEHFSLQLDRVRPAADASSEEVRGVTNFERRGERLGHDIADFEYVRS
jgi:tRNA (guanine-N7-)-methyltransferase